MNDHAQEARTRLQSAHGKKILITGGTSGVGLETARQLIAAGADVTVVGSGASKGKAAERSLNEAAGTGRATFVAADLSSLAAVRRLAATINERLDRLDVLILLHGFPSSSRMWEPLLSRLEDAFHLVAPDYPGFGHSDTPDPADLAYTFDHLAEGQCCIGRSVRMTERDRGGDKPFTWPS